MLVDSFYSLYTLLIESWAYLWGMKTFSETELLAFHPLVDFLGHFIIVKIMPWLYV